jgi:beta-lactamase class A
MALPEARYPRPVDRFRMAAASVLLLLATAALTAQTHSTGTPNADGRAPADAKRAALRQALERRLNDLAQSVDGVMGYEVVDLTTGARFGRLQDEVFPVASTIKLAILYELFKQADEGRLKLDEPKRLDPAHAVGGAGVLRELSAPSMPLRDYATLMIVLSDNTATNVVIDALGMQNVTARMNTLGLAATRLRRRMIDMEAARRGDENVSTPAEINRLLAIIDRGEGLTGASREGMLGILKKVKSSPMRRSIPPAVDVANKPGTLDGVAVDAGVVYVQQRPYTFSAMLTYLNAANDGDAAIEAASRAVYDYFVRVATSSEYGRAIR